MNGEFTNGFCTGNNLIKRYFFTFYSTELQLPPIPVEMLNEADSGE